MPYLNQVILLGHAGGEPKIQFSKDGNTKIAKFSLATSEKYKDKEETQWHNIVCFTHNADFVEKYLHKGGLVEVVGTVKYSQYDKEGTTIYRTDIVADKVMVLGSKQ